MVSIKTANACGPAGPATDGELHVDLEEADSVLVFPLKTEGRVRLVGTVREPSDNEQSVPTFGDVRGRAIQHLKLDILTVNWFSTYRVHHRVASHFRQGRTFLLGDAAHIHSPVGGQGMNTGIGDAVNLAWKLAMVLKEEAADNLLDTYEAERIVFARQLVFTTACLQSSRSGALSPAGCAPSSFAWQPEMRRRGLQRSAL